MTTAWVLNTVGLLATTVGTLILFLHLHRSQPAATACPSAACAKDRKLLKITLGLMSAWFVVQYLAVILI
jgi:hypothetical protein